MRATLTLCLGIFLLAAEPALADERFTLDMSGARLDWSDGTSLSPSAATPDGARAGPEVTVERLTPTSWRVARRDPDGEGEAWARTLHVDAALGAPSYRSAPQVAVRDVVVGLGGGALIAAIDLPTGLVRWQVRHVQEYVRSEEDPPNYDMRVLRVRGRGQRSRLLADAFVTAGPVVVPTEGGRYRVFVGVTESRRRETATPIETSRIYEIDAHGHVMSITRLPRELLPGGAVAIDGGVLLRLRGGALARVEPSYQSSGGWRGSGGTDRIGRLAWYMEAPPEPPDFPFERPDGPWLTTRARPEGFVALGPHLVLPWRGAEADRPEDGTWTFPLRRYDLRGRRLIDIALHVPFEGRVAAPKTNYRKSGNGNKRRFDAFRRHGAWLRRIDAEAGQLVVEVETDAGALHRLRFALPGVPAGVVPRAPVPSTPLPAEDPPHVPQDAPSLERLVARGLPEIRVSDPYALVEPLATAEPEQVARLAEIAVAGPSPLERAALYAIDEALPEEGVAHLPTGTLPALVRLLARDGLLYDGPLTSRLVAEAPDEAVAVLLQAQLESHSMNTQFDAAAPFQPGRALHDAGQEPSFERWLDSARNTPNRWYWGDGDEDEDPSRRRERLRRIRLHLADPDPRVRAAAATVLSDQRDDPAAREGTLDATRTLLGSAHLIVRRAGAGLAREHVEDGNEDAISLLPALVRALKTPDDVVLERCFNAIAALGPRADWAARAVREAFPLLESSQRWGVLFALGSIAGPDDAQTLAFLEKLASEPDDDFARGARWALAAIRKR